MKEKTLLLFILGFTLLPETPAAIGGWAGSAYYAVASGVAMCCFVGGLLNEMRNQ